jgi:hypothetical protein
MPATWNVKCNTTKKTYQYLQSLHQRLFLLSQHHLLLLHTPLVLPRLLGTLYGSDQLCLSACRVHV